MEPSATAQKARVGRIRFAAMRSERWYWLLGFCGLSICIHLGLLYRSRLFPLTTPVPQPHEIEITLAAWPDTKSPAVTELQPGSAQDRLHRPGTAAGQPRNRGVTPTTQQHPAASRANVEPGGEDRLHAERPLPPGLRTGQRTLSAPLLSVGQPTFTPLGGAAGQRNVTRNVITSAEPLPLDLPPPATAGGAPAAPQNAIPTTHDALNAPNPLADATKAAVKPVNAPDREHRAVADPERVSAAAASAQPGERPQPAAQNSPANADTGGKGTGNGPAGGSAAGNGAGTPGAARGTPYGDVNGKLHGDPHGGVGSGGGPGGSGRGGLFGVAPQLGGIAGGHLRIVYLLDTSGSMQEGDKIGRAREELKNAIAKLSQFDRFDVINFDVTNHAFAPGLVPATLPNVLDARNYVDAIGLGDWTNLSGALEAALAMPDVTHIYVLSDGEPNRGITDFALLCAMVHEHNPRHIHINAFALGLGEKFQGMALLKTLADQNDGEYRSVIMRR
jgi:hypothetical protein